ncbi:hypothetical protein [Methylomagnum sp.]
MAETHHARGAAICERLQGEIAKLDFPPDQIPRPPVYDEARFETQNDPFSGAETLCGTWTLPNGQKAGEIKLHADGSFYAEYDVVLPHPTDARWFVESVVAWGRDDVIKSEVKLLSALGE